MAQTIRVITYNIRYDSPKDGENKWELRKDNLCDQLKFYEPDVFGIQEGLLHQVNYINNALKGYEFVGVGRDDGKKEGEFSAIFYKTNKLKVIKQGTFWLSKTPKEVSVGWDASMERICTYAHFKDLELGDEFWVFNTHFDHIGALAREKSAALILEQIKSFNKNNLPVILMGDFNLMPESKPIELVLNSMNDTKLTATQVSFGPDGTYNGFDFDKAITRRIDYIFTSKNNIKVLKYATISDSKDFKYYSDHLPVLAEIELNTGQ
ncbi:MAG: endonuclease/exonuclease/phosphatase family protein [Cyclobacteriaceae bacterium]|nr:endonuclease/exonuclease/phosphatase family protein [Cyclobacteriaceae bacterium]